MKRLGHGWLSAIERLAIWQRWREGERVTDIARYITRSKVLVRREVVAAGGVAPRTRRRSCRSLNPMEREEISRGICRGLSFRGIARLIDRPSSTVTREVARNGGRKAYRAAVADQRAAEQAQRPKPCKLGLYPRLRREVARKLQLRWSPEQISAWLKKHFASPTMNVSHETIYQSLFIQARGLLKAELIACLRSGRQIRGAGNRGRGRNPNPAVGKIPDAISIRERPADVEDRAIPGHWEGDLIAGGRRSFVATLVERTTRFVLLVKVDSKESDVVVDALIRAIRKLPEELRRSLTWDRGHEMRHHQRFTLATDMKVYFCDPQSPWQRGSNENTNRLLRQYFPKGLDLSSVTQPELNRVARELNGRPRETLDWRTPAEALAQVMQ